VPPVTIDVSPTQPWLQLARVLPGQSLTDMGLPELQRTTAQGPWWLGRHRMLRLPFGQKTHAASYS